MSRYVWIVKKNTPESKLLGRIGIDRSSLTVVEWKGKKRSRGGFGKTPIAWRVTGRKDLEKLSLGLLERIERKPQSERSQQEQRSLERAKGVLEHFEKRDQQGNIEESKSKRRLEIFRPYLRRLYPNATDDDLVAALNLVDSNPNESFERVFEWIDNNMGPRGRAWNRARKEFVTNVLKQLSQEPRP